MTAWLCLAALPALLLLAAGVYCWHCTHYWQGPLRRTRRAGFLERTSASRTASGCTWYPLPR